jgi:hypothetical protein
LAIDPTYSKGVSQAIPSHSDCHGTTRIMPGPTSGKDALGVSLLAGLLATVDEVIEGIVRCPSWHNCDALSASSNVRDPAQSGKHLLAMSISRPDPGSVKTQKSKDDENNFLNQLQPNKPAKFRRPDTSLGGMLILPLSHRRSVLTQPIPISDI